MPKKTKCALCGKLRKVTWANYKPYCEDCLSIKSKSAVPFEETFFFEDYIKEELQKIKGRLDKLEKRSKS